MTALALVWEDGYSERTNDAPKLSDVVEQLSLLDGVGRTLVTLYRGDTHLACGGSAKSGLIAYVTFDNAVFWQLASPSQASVGEVSVVAGGQAGQYAARHVVDLPAAVSAATAFYETGSLADAQTWDMQ